MPLLTLLRGQDHRVRLEYKWLQRGLLFHLGLSVVPVADSMVTTGELTVSRFSRVATTRTLEISLSAAFAAAEQEQRKKDQDKYTTSNRTTNDVLPVA